MKYEKESFHTTQTLKVDNAFFLSFQAQCAKSLPSLSSYLSSKGRSAIIQIEPKLDHGNSEQNGNDWRKSTQCSTENVVSNGAKSNAFKSATQKYSMLPNNTKVY